MESWFVGNRMKVKGIETLEATWLLESVILLVVYRDVDYTPSSVTPYVLQITKVWVQFWPLLKSSYVQSP